MLPKTVSLCLLLVGVARSDLGQGLQNGNQNQQGGSPYYNNNNNNGNGQNPYYNNNGNGQGLGQGYNNNGYNNPQPGLGQGYNNNNNQGQTYPGVGNGGNYNGNNQGYAGLGNNQNSGYQGDGYAGLGTAQDQTRQQVENADVLTPFSRNQNDRRNQNGYDSNRGLTPINEQQRYKRNLGQDIQPQGLGQDAPQPQGLGQGAPQPQGLGQGAPQPQGLGQGAPQPQGLGQGLGNGQSDLGGSLSGNLRKKRYAEREPYRKSCNTYYGKYICYRLYDSTASIPNDFTCWQTYTGKKNCTETENILYLDRRNVEVDPDEGLGRRFQPNRDNNDRLPTLPTHQDTRRDRYRERDDEFGAVEKNLHNQRHGDRRLPDDDY